MRTPSFSNPTGSFSWLMSSCVLLVVWQVLWRSGSVPNCGKHAGLWAKRAVGYTIHPQLNSTVYEYAARRMQAASLCNLSLFFTDPAVVTLWDYCWFVLFACCIQKPRIMLTLPLVECRAAHIALMMAALSTGDSLHF